MKYKFFPLLYFALFVFATASLHAQTADVSAGCIPLVVQFEAPSDASSFFWDFQDGTAPSELENPRHTFNEAGTFEVAFSTSSTGDVVGTITIQVFERPVIDVAIDPVIGCAPADITLTNVAEVPAGMTVNYSWDFQDFEDQSGQSITLENVPAGTYSYSLILTPNFSNCNSSQEFIDAIQVVDKPQASFSVAPQSLFCTGPATVSLTNESTGDNLSYFWDFGNGTTSTEANPAPITYELDGDYMISLTVVNGNECTDNFTRIVTIGNPTADFSVSDTVCVATETTLENTSSGGSYAWTITGPSNFSSTAVSPVFDFPLEGAYTITLDVTEPTGTCNQSITKTVFAQNIDATFTAEPTYGCVEPFTVAFTPLNPAEGATYEWDFGDDSTSTEVSPSHDFNADNESPFHFNGEFFFTTTLKVSTNAGCMDEFQVVDTLDIPLARFMPDTIAGCAPLEVEFSDSSFSTTPIVNWEYFYGDGNAASFDNNDPHTYTYNEPGEFDVQLVITNELDCPDTSFVIRVEVGERITPDFTTDKTSVCQGELIQFTDITNNPNIDEWHYYTDDDRSSHCFQEANPLIPFETETGLFEVNMVVGYNGCLDSIVRADFIEVLGPIAHIEYSIECETPNTVQFSSISNDATTVTWDFGDGQTATDVTLPHDYESTGDYMVFLTAENPSTGCAPSLDSAMIQIRNIQADGPVDFDQCRSQPLMLNSENSTDVDTSCFRGYTWFFNHPSVRPVTTNMPTVDDVSYPDTGSYRVDLVVEDVNGCTDTASYPIFVHEAMVSFELDRDRVCPGLPVNITNVTATTTAQSIESYMWDFGDNVGMSEEENPGSYTYNADVTGNQVTISVSIEDDAGCPGSAEQTIELYRITSAINGNNNVCVGETVNLQAINSQNLDLSYTWDLGNGEEAMGQEVSTIYDEGAIFTVNLRMVEAGTGCVGLANTMVEVQDFPIADFEIPSPLCAPSAVTFTNTSLGLVETAEWTFDIGGQTTISNEINPTRNFLTDGQGLVSLVVATSNGCESDISKTITVEPLPQGDFNIDNAALCAGDVLSVNLINPSNVESFSWAFEDMPFGDNQDMATFSTPSETNNPNARVELLLEGRGGCRDVITRTVSVTSPQPSFSTSIDPCFFSVTATNTTLSPLASVIWDSGENMTSSNLDSATFVYTAEGTFTISLTATDASGCTNTVTQTVNLVRNTITDGIIPNAFTPETTGSGTGLNDIFRVKNVDESTGLCSPVRQVLNFAVYNRWGTEVYSATNIPIEEGWDGRFKNRIQPAGVYVYAIEVEYEDNTTELFKGDVTLIR